MMLHEIVSNTEILHCWFESSMYKGSQCPSTGPRCYVTALFIPKTQPPTPKKTTTKNIHNIQVLIGKQESKILREIRC